MQQVWIWLWMHVKKNVITLHGCSCQSQEARLTSSLHWWRKQHREEMRKTGGGPPSCRTWLWLRRRSCCDRSGGGRAFSSSHHLPPLCIVHKYMYHRGSKKRAVLTLCTADRRVQLHVLSVTLHLSSGHSDSSHCSKTCLSCHWWLQTAYKSECGWLLCWQRVQDATLSSPQRSWDGPQEALETLNAGEAVRENQQMNVTRHSQPAQIECWSYNWWFYTSCFQFGDLSTAGERSNSFLEKLLGIQAAPGAQTIWAVLICL